jgi:hypothetical protein
MHGHPLVESRMKNVKTSNHLIGLNKKSLAAFSQTYLGKRASASRKNLAI